MSSATIGDLSRSTAFMRYSSTLKQSIEDRTRELGTGVTSDIHSRLRGNYAALSDITRNLVETKSYKTITSEAAALASALQSSLAYLQDLGAGLSSTLLDGSADSSETVVSRQARSDFSSMVSTLNTSVGGRSLFAGAAVTKVPLPDAETILSDLSTSLAGLTDPGDIRAAVDAWFGTGGGFETSVYSGSTTDIQPIPISENRRANLGVRADDASFRNLLKQTAIVALAGDAVLGLSSSAAADLRKSAGQALLAVADDLTGKRATLGFEQARIEETQAAHAAKLLSLEQSRSSLISADPYEAATRLEDSQFRLEALYSVFSRSASLKLVNFL